MRQLNSIEIFSGAGGLAKGLELAGTKHRAFVEWNADACRTLRENYDSSLVFEGDIRNFSFSDYSDVDILAGGPPCQPFSLGGKAKGCDDKRDMFPAAISAIRTLMPKAFVFENVKGLLRKSFAEYFDFILLQLKYPGVELKHDDWRKNVISLKAIDKSNKYSGLRYNVTYKLVNAANYGVPQKRERVIMVGFRSDLNIEWSFPKSSHSEDALLWDKFVSGNYWKRHGINNPVQAQVCEEIKQKLVAKYGLFAPEEKPWNTIRDAFVGLDENYVDDSLWNAKPYPGHTGSAIDEPSKTIKAGDHGVPGGENMVRFSDGTTRYLSVSEAKRIQTFPDTYSISGSWTEAMRQIGNAVPVLLARIVGESVLNVLGKTAMA
ncbi:MAG: DNA (cytosine-5-)-methyltransferase [Bacteroidales bacterium]|nr:DNA (cytosine-5-)-methyltransferase [Bacteroidales bacterium]